MAWSLKHKERHSLAIAGSMIKRNVSLPFFPPVLSLELLLQKRRQNLQKQEKSISKQKL